MLTPSVMATIERDEAKPAETGIPEMVKIVREYLTAPKTPNVPQELLDDEAFVALAADFAALRDALGRFSQGELTYKVKGRGFLFGCIKALQSNLKSLTWYAGRLADGDFGHRIDFMGTFSESFNEMSARLNETMSELRESEANLLALTEELHASEERWKLAVVCSQNGIWDISIDSKRAYFSNRLLEMLHGLEVEIETTFDQDKWRRHVLPDDLPVWDAVMRQLEGAPDESDGRYFELRLRGSDGCYRWIGAHYILIRNAQGRPIRFVGTMENIQERRERDEAIRLQATHDNLTGLPNRYLYNDRLAQQMVIAKRSRTALILGIWDLDSFKVINDTYGHLAGDCLLRGVAQRMSSCLRETETLARFGGDEFVMLLTCPRGEETSVAEHTTQRVFEALQEPIDIGGISVVACASCGLSFYPKYAASAEELFDLADRALYMAKGKGMASAQIWTPPEDEA